MATVRFTKHLIRFFPDLANQAIIEAQGDTVAGVVNALDEKYPGLAAYVVDEQGALRKHVNIFLDDELIHDRQKLQDPVAEDDRIYIFQALSGG
jgi:molybdopterin converting factor small subunit